MQQLTAFKVCKDCGHPKLVEEFYRHPQIGDGRLNACKECHKRAVIANREKKREYYSAYEQERFQRPERKANASDYQKTLRRINPDKYKARNAVNNALRDGRLVKESCQHCGTTDKVEAHHSDYSRPLDIEWVCFRCHREVEHGQVVVTA